MRFNQLKVGHVYQYRGSSGNSEFIIFILSKEKLKVNTFSYFYNEQSGQILSFDEYYKKEWSTLTTGYTVEISWAVISEKLREIIKWIFKAKNSSWGPWYY